METKVELLKTLPHNDFRRGFEFCKACSKQRVA